MAVKIKEGKDEMDQRLEAVTAFTNDRINSGFIE
jgi:hypothetical protein